MSNALLSSKVVIEEEQPKVRTIQAVQTSIVASVGVTERGPIATPTLVTSETEFQAIFGGFTANSDLAHAVRGFFENGGQFLFISRTVHYTDPSIPGTATAVTATLNLLSAATGPTAGSVTGTNTAPFVFTAAGTIIVNVDAGGNLTATFDATAATQTSSNVETYVLVDGQTLTFGVNGGGVQTVTFNTAEFVAIGAATAAEVAAVINAEATGIAATAPGTAVIITTDRIGSSASLDTFGGTAAATLGFSGSAAGTGDVADISAVTVAEIKTVMEADIAGLTVNDVASAVQIVSNTTGPSSSILVDASSTMDTVIGVDNATHSGTVGAAVNTLQVDGKTEGAYANDLTIRVEAATNAVADDFNLVVIDDGIELETFPNLNMNDLVARYAEAVINDGSEESNLIAVIDLDAATTQRPANGTFGPLTGGDDGLTGLTDADFVGAAAGATGLRAYDQTQDLTILIVPGQATSAVQNAMITYVEETRDGSMFAILESPPGSTATTVITYFDTTASLLGLSEFGAAYWPLVEVLNPSEAVFGTVANLVVTPSGHIAGVYARTDANRPGGIYDPPAGIEEGVLRGIQGFETAEVLDEAKRDLVFPKRINILTTFTGVPRHIDGSRCLKGDGNFPFVAQRRGAIFIEQSVKNGTQFARNKNNTPKLRRTVERTIRQFLILQMRNEAFSTQDPDTAFFVEFSDRLNPRVVSNAGQMIGRVGLAFNTPAEFIIIKFSRDTRALEQELAG